MLKLKTGGLIIAISSVAILVSFLINSFFSLSLKQVAQRAQKSISNKLEECNAVLTEIVNNPSPEKDEANYTAFDEKKIGLYVFKNDSLLFWNNAQLPVDQGVLNLDKPQGLLKLKYGYYLYSRRLQGSTKAYAVCLIKPLYDLQNNYLKNEFSSWTKIPEEINLSEKTQPEAGIYLNKQYLFSLKGGEHQYFNKEIAWACSVMFLLGLVSLTIGLLIYFHEQRTYKALIIAVVPMVILKFLIALKPELLSNSFLYDLRLFANAQSLLNNSLADVVFNSIALLFISVLLNLKFKNSKNISNNKVSLFVLFILAFVIVWQFNHSLKSLVTNSTLSFDFLSVFNIKVAAVAGLLSLVFNSLALFVVYYRITSFFDKANPLHFVWFTFFNFILCCLMYIFFPLENFWQNLWPMLFTTVLYLLIKFQYQKLSLGMGVLILVMSAITSGFFNLYIDKNVKQHLEVLSYSLSERQDPFLENEFADLPLRISSDEKLKILLNFLPSNEKEISLLLKQKFFSGYFNRYNIDFSLFDKNCKPLLQPTQPILLNEGFFEDQIHYFSDSTFSAGLFFVKMYKKNSRYISKIKLDDKNLYVLLEPKQFEELGSFPDLLLDQSQQRQENLKNSSYAVYRGEQNTSRYGDFNYPYYYVDSTALANAGKEYVHHYYAPDESTHIIISKKAKNWKYLFTYNSYLFLFFSIVSFFCYYVYAYLFTANFKNASLTRRIQTIVIVLLLLAMSAVGITSGSLVSKQFETDNIRQLHEKTQIIINELNAKFKPEELFISSQKDLVNFELKELTHLFNTDVSLFDNKGVLFNTSQPRLYDKGLASTLATPKAYFSLKGNQVSAYTNTESAGTLKYLSLYTPLFNSQKQLLGFVNLPYFAKQSDLVNELSGIISALINVYVILFVISILAGLILSGYITKPLRMIKQQIANITLGKQNEMIKWSSNDEVGKLVNEYNNMLIKLEHSANLLAQSERESAWREMAKQVAHEIKNPLTPMKLNLQYLQHVMKNDPGGFREKFETASSGIIEQIDALAAIANEFSNFAKLPQAKLQKINLTEVINSAVNLFDQKSSALIVNKLPEQEMWVLGDKEQALRVFNNVLKNAIQATEDVKEPQIIVTVSSSLHSYTLVISDNGCGIPPAMKDKIFEPNFTTKSTGSGLGLAIVKSIITSFGGKINFESEENKGTRFYIDFVKE
ncbi:MAG: HAMP domain-containing histidine kinase [Bacteroidetes bacterium]|nr:HAMP domain-containing histidine kinase [Bacteroidota bacterium]